MNEEVQKTLLEIADDELILGWRDSEWTGIAPLLEEDVAFSSIAQNEIGHARALYELVARERGRTCFRSLAGRVPVRAERRAAPAGLGPDDRPPLPLRGSGCDQARTAEAVGRCRDSGPGGEDRPGRGLSPHACADVARAFAERAPVSGGVGGASPSARPTWR